MIANNVIQAAIIAALKADTDLIAWLTAQSAGDEVRETQWQGAAFVYPAVRVEVGSQTPEIETSSCYETNGTAFFSILSFTEDDSSQSADILADLVNEAIFGKRISGTGFASLSIRSDGLTHASRTGERTWRAMGLYRMYIYGT